MNRTKIAGMTLTEDEYNKLLAHIRVMEETENKRISVSTFLRDTVLPRLNNSPPDSIPIIVSSEPTHTDSKQKNKDAPWNDLEFN